MESFVDDAGTVITEALPDLPSEDGTSALVALFSHYVSGYHHAHPLNEREVRAVIPLMLLTLIGGAYRALHGWEPSSVHYQRNLESIAWITSRFEVLSQAAEML